MERLLDALGYGIRRRPCRDLQSKTVAEIIAGEEHLDARSLPAIWSKIRPILIAKVLVYSALFLLGPRVGAVRHGTRPRILVSGLFTDGIGGLISLVKMLCH